MFRQPPERLPAELLVHIIGSIAYHEQEWQNDWVGVCPYSGKEREAKDTLLACSLASRHLRNITFPYLFHSMALRVDFNVGKVHDSGVEGWRTRTLDELEKFLDSCQRACYAIQELRICGADIVIDVGGYTGPSTPQIGGTELLALVKILARLHRLRVLALRDVLFGNLTSLGTEGLDSSSALPILEQFHYSMHDNIQIIDSSAVLTLMNCFPGVKRVYFDRFGFQVSDDLDRALSFPTTLRSFKVSGCWYNEEFLSLMVRDISKRRICMPIESIELDSGIMQSEKVSELLVLVNTSLKILSLHHLLDTDSWAPEEGK